MPRGTFLLVSALLVTTVTLFAATDVRATDQCTPTTCCTTSDKSFKIRFEGVFADESCKGDIYRYTVSSGSESINRLSLLEFTLERGLSATGRFVCNGVGGQPSFKFAKDIPQVCVFTAPSDVSSHPTVDICVTGAGGNVDLIGVHAQASTKIQYDGKSKDDGKSKHDDDDSRAKNGTCIIKGPTKATKGLPAFVSIVPKLVEIRGCVYSIEIDSQTGCPLPTTSPVLVSGDESKLCKQPLDQDPNFTISSTNIPSEFPESHSLKYNQGTDGNPGCPIGKIVGGSPDCEWITIGGTAYGPICF